MKKILSIITLISAIFLVVGCISPSPERIAQIGPKPKTYSIPKSAFDDFKDPESVRMKRTNLPLRRAYLMENAAPAWTGWVATVKINAKNSYGAYNGYTHYYALLENGQAFSMVSSAYPAIHFID